MLAPAVLDPSHLFQHLGYGAGYGLSEWLERFRRSVGLKEDLALFAAILAVAGVAFIVMTWSHRHAGTPPL